MNISVPLLVTAIAFGLLLTPVTVAAQEAPADPSDGFEYTYPEERIEHLRGLAEQMATYADSADRNFGMLVDEAMETMPGSPALANLQHHEQWTIAGSTDALISLGGTIYEYSGGAHGNTSFAALLWDVESDRGIALTDLFTDRYAALAEIDSPYCAALRTMQRERGLGEGEWGPCPLLHEMTVVPASDADSGPFIAMRVLVPPYAAGPYSVGEFEIDVPVTTALRALVKPEYRESFASPERR